MINIAFVNGSSLRRVVIDGRKISMSTPETGNLPMTFDLDKIKVREVKKKMGKEGLKFLEEMKLLKSEAEMAKDVVTDFQRTGWRRIKQSGSNK